MNKVDKIINESIKDSIKKGIKKYKDTFSYNEDEDADNPAAIDFKQATKDAWKSTKNSIKKGIKKYKDTFSYNEDEDADNPAAIDFKQAGKDAMDWLRGKKKKSVQEGKQIIRLTESDLHRLIKESVKQVLSESMSSSYDNALKETLTKAFHGLTDNEKTFLYNLLNQQTWDVVYAALAILKPDAMTVYGEKMD